MGETDDAAANKEKADAAKHLKRRRQTDGAQQLKPVSVASENNPPIELLQRLATPMWTKHGWGLSFDAVGTADDNKTNKHEKNAEAEEPKAQHDTLREMFGRSIRQQREQDSDSGMPPLLSLRRFLEGFVPPDYLIDGIVQRRFIYSFTGQTGHAKTALALLIASLVGALKPGAMFGNHAVEQGQVVDFAGENPDDVRMRLIGMDVDLDTRISVIPGVFDIDAMLERLAKEMQSLGCVDLIIIDTSAAYFLGDDEQSNAQMGQHARTLRKLTTMPGGPCVLVLCHPIKHVTEPAQLLPRGGGAFLNEMDGNLTAWLRNDLVTLHHNKIRGPGFEPMTFKIERVTTTKLVDSKGRLLPTVKAVAVTEREEATEKQGARDEENQLLTALAENPNRSLAELARACAWFWITGEPAKSKVERVLGRLKADRLVRLLRGEYVLTDEGKKAVKAAKGNEKGDENGDERDDKPADTAFRSIIGQRVHGIECVHCCKEYGQVFRIRDGRVKNGRAEVLHLHCAEAWFGGRF
jgi:hypothetical protein